MGANHPPTQIEDDDVWDDAACDWLTVKEFAQMKRVTARTVRDWIRDEKIQAERTAGDHGQWRIKKSHAFPNNVQ